MKPDIQENMETRIETVSVQNTYFDTAITAIETETAESATRISSTLYRVVDSEFIINIALDESLYDGVVTIAIIKNNLDGEIRYATMTITSNNIISESYSNVDTEANRTYMTNLFGAVFDAIRGIDGGES